MTRLPEHDGMWGVFERGILLVADSQQQCLALQDRWKRISGIDYEARELTGEEVETVLQWERDPW